MKLSRARNVRDWKRAGKLLLAVVDKLDEQGKSLWTRNQVSEKALQQSYQLSELYFFEENDCDIGLVFIQTADPVFWPEIEENTSLFFHKLAIHPSYSRQGRGAAAIGLIKDYAGYHQYRFLRVDCDDRKVLKQFYLNLGFDLVKEVRMNGFNVLKFEYPI